VSYVNTWYLIVLCGRLFATGDDCIEYLENAIEMLSYLTYYPSTVNGRLWEIFGPLMVAMDDWGYDYMMELTTPVMNFIAKDTDTFMRGSFGENTYISMVLTVSQKALEHDFSDQEREAKAGAMLLGCIIAHGKDGSVDHLIEPIMSVSFLSAIVFLLSQRAF
jgi:importin-7